MRQIKFRAWDGSKMHQDVVMVDGKAFKNEVNAGTPMQFTGLQDRKGKDIYEGDLMTAHGQTGIVKWIDAGWRVEWKNYDSYLIQVTYGVVIGNIYSNPELLEATP